MGGASHLEGGDVEVLPEGQTQNVQVLSAIAERTGKGDEDCREEEEESSLTGRPTELWVLEEHQTVLVFRVWTQMF